MTPHTVEVAKWNVVSGLCYNPILGFIKASMILLYLRLSGTQNGIRLACYGLLTLTLSLTLELDLADAFEQMWEKRRYGRGTLHPSISTNDTMATDTTKSSS